MHKRWKNIAKALYLYLFKKDMDYVNGLWIKEKKNE